MQTKSELRKKIIEQRRLLPSALLQQAAEVMAARLSELRLWEQSRTLGVYLALAKELPTQPFIERAWRAGKNVCAPYLAQPGAMLEFRRIHIGMPLPLGLFGIPSPGADAPLLAPDLLLVPGLAFSPHGFRLGYGGGYFDRYLSLRVIPTVGLCLERFLFSNLPVAPHDRPVSWLLTEQRVWESGS